MEILLYPTHLSMYTIDSCFDNIKTTKNSKLTDFENSALQALREALMAYNPLASDQMQRLVYSTYFENDCYVLQLYIPGNLPGDALVIAQASRHEGKEIKVEVFNLTQISALIQQ